MNGDGREFLAGQFVEVDCAPEGLSSMVRRIGPERLLIHKSIFRAYMAMGTYLSECDRCRQVVRVHSVNNSVAPDEMDVNLAEVEHSVNGCNGRLVTLDG